MFSASESETGFDVVVSAAECRRSWEEVDHALRELARGRSAMDADEARLLIIAVRDEIWRRLGAGSLYEYLENVLGYGPREAHERVRVARALADIPELEDELAVGALHWSAVRELTRVATPATAAQWVAAVRGKNLRQVEQLVSGRKKGDTPDDRPDPDTGTRRLAFEVRPETIAMLRRARQELEAERGVPVDDEALLATLCRAYLEGGSDDGERGLARFQVMTVVCEACGGAAHEAAGRRHPIDEAGRAIAECDAQWIGSDREPARATQDVSPATRRFVHRRDAGKCCVPGCRASRFIDVHHIVPRDQGGGHHAGNLTLMCAGHHRALHEGQLSITGSAPHLVVRSLVPASSATSGVDQAPASMRLPAIHQTEVDAAHGPADLAKSYSPIAHDGPATEVMPVPPPTSNPRLTQASDLARIEEHASLVHDAKLALVGLQVSKRVADAAVEATWTAHGPDVELGRLIYLALRSLNTRPQG